MTLRSIAIALLIAFWLPIGAGADSLIANGVPWADLADVETVEVLTQDEDGESRETVIWLIVVDGEGYIRTGGTSWGDNVARDPNIALRIEETEYRVQAEFVEDDALRETITAAFREKYGWSDAMISPIRGSRPRIMHLLPR